MVLALDPALSDVCRRLNEHRRCSSWLRTRCAAGCGRWPCGTFLRALEEMLRSSWLSHQTGMVTHQAGLVTHGPGLVTHAAGPVTHHAGTAGPIGAPVPDAAGQAGTG